MYDHTMVSNSWRNARFAAAMSDSDASTGTDGTSERPEDACWQFFDKVSGPVGKDGKPTWQSTSNRAQCHRVSKGCKLHLQVWEAFGDQGGSNIDLDAMLNARFESA